MELRFLNPTQVQKRSCYVVTHTMTSKIDLAYCEDRLELFGTTGGTRFLIKFKTIKGDIFRSVGSMDYGFVNVAVRYKL